MLMPAKLPPKAISQPRQAFAVRLHAARIAAGYSTMRDFAAALGIEEARYRRWKRQKPSQTCFFYRRFPS